MGKPNDAKRHEVERADVKDTMEKVTDKEPGEFRDEANEKKRVEIGKDLTDDPIQGIDPKS